MTTGLRVLRAGPGVTVQDLGRPGLLAQGVSCGGAADRLALFEGAALLGQAATHAALEMAGFGGVFEATADLRIALTGAPMRADVDGAPVAWNASHLLRKGARLSLGAATEGSYGYLHLGGGVDAPVVLGSRSVHLAAGIGAPVQSGSLVAAGPDPRPEHVGFCLDPAPRFQGGVLRAVPGPQTGLFAKGDIARFADGSFRRDTRGNRMGVRLLPDGVPFATGAGLSILSDAVVPGDIQVTGDGTPFVLLSECQTTGGYPRIGTVIRADLPRIAQAVAGSVLSFVLLTPEEGAAADAAERRRIAALPGTLRRLIRDPAAIRDLLGYQLIDGVTAGDDLGRAP
jgi:biotin-dependent carboxylase-like uncharacterized protein